MLGEPGAVAMNEVDAYTRLAGVYDEIVVGPLLSLMSADFLAGWRSDPWGVRSVLDVCCGTGLMAGELIERGYPGRPVSMRRRQCSLVLEARLGSGD